MHTSLHEYVLARLQEVTTEDGYDALAKGSGVPKSTLKKIKWRQIKDPGVSHIEALARFFREAAQAA
jgi:hypothetical protein